MHSATSRIAVSGLTGLACLLMGLFELTYMGGWFLNLLGGITMLSGVSIVVGGIVVGLNSPPQLEPRPGEHIQFEGHPSMKPAFVSIAVGILLLVAGVYSIEVLDGAWSVVPPVLLVIGVYLCCKGIVKYWITHCTTYYATSDRFVVKYRFLRGYTLEIPVDRSNIINSNFGLVQRLTGRGSLSIATGGGGDTQVVEFHDVDDPGEVERIVDLITFPDTSTSSSI